MEINGPRLPPLLISPSPSPSEQLNWRNGQLLQALVLRVASQNEQALLQIGRQQFEAQTKAPLQQGQRIIVEVIKAEASTPLLKLHTPPTSPDQTLANQLKVALPRQAPLQPLLANINWLQQNNQQPLLNALPASVTDALKALRQQSPSRENISSAQGLKEALQNSGLFLEKKILSTASPKTPRQTATLAPQTQANLNADIKTQLSRVLNSTQQEISRIERNTRSKGSERALAELSARLATFKQLGTLLQRPILSTARPVITTALLPLIVQTPSILPRMNETKPATPYQAQQTANANTTATLAGASLQSSALLMLKELARQTAGALARVRLNQLSALPTQEQPLPPLLFEIPVRNGERLELLKLRIEEDESQKQHDGSDDKNKTTTVSLSLNLSNLGPLHARVSLTDERIIATLWAEHPETLNLIQTHLPELHQRMRDAGIQMDPVQCLEGSPPETKHNNIPRIQLDEKA